MSPGPIEARASSNGVDKDGLPRARAHRAPSLVPSHEVHRSIPTIQDRLRALYGPTGLGDPYLLATRKRTLRLALDILYGMERRKVSGWDIIGPEIRGKGDRFRFFHRPNRMGHQWRIGQNYWWNKIFRQGRI